MEPAIVIFHKDHPLYASGPNGGAEGATRDLARFLVKAGRRVVLAGILPEGTKVQDGVEYWDIGQSFNIRHALVKARTLGVYHLISAGRAAPLLESRGEARTLSRTLLCHDPSGSATGLENKLLSPIINGFVTVSKAQAKMLVDNGADALKTHVIHNGVDLDLFRASPGQARNAMKLVFVGAIVPHKGVHVLVETFASLKDRYPALELDIIGSGALWGKSDYMDLRALCQRIPGLRHHGKLSQAEVVSILQRAGLYLGPSIWFEALGMASIEAQATGCPAVVFDSGGLRETVVEGETGLVVEDITTDGLIRAVDSLVSRPAELARMSRRAVELRERFSWPKAAQEFCRLLDGYKPSDRRDPLVRYLSHPCDPSEASREVEDGYTLVVENQLLLDELIAEGIAPEKVWCLPVEQRESLLPLLIANRFGWNAASSDDALTLG